MTQVKDATVVEGTVRNVNDGGLRLEGEDEWRNFSKPDYRKEPWTEVNPGDPVRLTIVDTAGGPRISTVQLIMPTVETPTRVIEAPKGKASEFRTPDQIIRTEALRCAVDAMSTHINPDYDQAAYLSTIEALALRWAALIETGEPE